MPLPRISPARYRTATFVALALLVAIVVTGALVRLTDSGLGCTDWPNCNSTTFVDVSTRHSAIEQLNRLFTGAVTVAVIVAVLGAVLRSPRRRDLTWLSLGLVAGVLGQALLGAVVVLTDLNPVAVQGHFLLSMALLADGIVLHRRAGQPDGGVRRPLLPTGLRYHAWGIVGATAVAIVAGTVVTGAGPHSGSHDGAPVPRFGIAIVTAARVHATFVWITVALALALTWRVRNRRAEREVVETPLRVFVVLCVAQGLLGYVQYASGVPAGMVAVHIALACAVWLCVLDLALGTVAVEPSDVIPAPPAVPVAAAPTSPTSLRRPGPVRSASTRTSTTT